MALPNALRLKASTPRADNHEFRTAAEVDDVRCIATAGVACRWN
jgi:hypothetical protein